MQNKPTILIATGTMNAGGTESLIMEMLRHQTGRVRNVLLIHYKKGVIQKGMFDDEIKALGIEVLYIPSVGDLGIIKYCRKFKEVVNALGDVDIIHSHLNANGGIICKAAKIAGIKHRICHCHADIRFNGSKTQIIKREMSLQLQRLFVNRYGNHFWACSHEAWKRLFYFWKKEVIIPNMINVEKYISSPKQKQEAKNAIGMKGYFVVGSIGRVARIKNYEFALKVIEQLNKEGKDTHYVCYGRFDAENDAYCRELILLAERLNIADKIHFMGNTTNVAHDINAFDVFLMPSITEGFGMAAIEAQAAGIPTLLSTGIPHIVDMELNLVKFMPLKIEEWRKVIGDLYNKAKKNNLQFISNSSIISAFDKRGYNSVSMVRKIENKYLEICH